MHKIRNCFSCLWILVREHAMSGAVATILQTRQTPVVKLRKWHGRKDGWNKGARFSDSDLGATSQLNQPALELSYFRTFYVGFKIFRLDVLTCSIKHLYSLKLTQETFPALHMSFSTSITKLGDWIP